MPEFTSIDGQIVQKDENDHYEFILVDLETANSIRIITKKIVCADEEKSELFKQIGSNNAKK